MAAAPLILVGDDLPASRPWSSLLIFCAIRTCVAPFGSTSTKPSMVELPSPLLLPASSHLSICQAGGSISGPEAVGERGLGSHSFERFASDLPPPPRPPTPRRSALEPPRARVAPPSIDAHHHGLTAPASPPHADWMGPAHNSDEGASGVERNHDPRSTNGIVSSPSISVLSGPEKRAVYDQYIEEGLKGMPPPGSHDRTFTAAGRLQMLSLCLHLVIQIC